MPCDLQVKCASSINLECAENTTDFSMPPHGQKGILLGPVSWDTFHWDLRSLFQCGPLMIDPWVGILVLTFIPVGHALQVSTEVVMPLSCFVRARISHFPQRISSQHATWVLLYFNLL